MIMGVVLVQAQPRIINNSQLTKGVTMDWNRYFSENQIQGESAKQARTYSEPTIVINACGQVKLYACKGVDLKNLLYKILRDSDGNPNGLAIFTLPDSETAKALAKAKKLRKCITSETDSAGNLKAEIIPNIRLPKGDGEYLYNQVALANPDKVERVSSGASVSDSITINTVEDGQGGKGHQLVWSVQASESVKQKQK